MLEKKHVETAAIVFKDYHTSPSCFTDYRYSSISYTSLNIASNFNMYTWGLFLWAPPLPPKKINNNNNPNMNKTTSTSQAHTKFTISYQLHCYENSLCFTSLSQVTFLSIFGSEINNKNTINWLPWYSNTKTTH